MHNVDCLKYSKKNCRSESATEKCNTETRSVITIVSHIMKEQLHTDTQL